MTSFFVKLFILIAAVSYGSTVVLEGLLPLVGVTI